MEIVGPTLGKVAVSPESKVRFEYGLLPSQRTGLPMRMRFIGVILASALLSFGQVRAQNTLSLWGGLSVASLEEDGLGYRNGLKVGGAVTFPVSDRLGIEAGGAYVQKGFTETVEGVDLTLALDYMQFPVLLRIDVLTTDALSPHLSLGPAVAFELGCTIEGSEQGTTVSLDCRNSEVGLLTKSTDFGALFGAGLDVAASEAMSLTFEGFFDLGLTSISDQGGDVKNWAWAFLAGVAFPIG